MNNDIPAVKGPRFLTLGVLVGGREGPKGVPSRIRSQENRTRPYVSESMCVLMYLYMKLNDSNSQKDNWIIENKIKLKKKREKGRKIESVQ
jgi:hypothetical protein